MVEQHTVLLAEDDAGLARAVAANLSARGWRVTCVTTGAEVIASIQRDSPDVVPLDICLPDMSGIQVLSAVRNLRQAPPVVLISGFLDFRTTLHLAQVLQNVVEFHTATPVSGSSTITELVGTSPALARLRDHIERVARFPDLPVLIIGESGTGKELVAQAVHRLGASGGPLVALNCAAVPEGLFESELFGHTQGAFTGAKGPRQGLLESAGHGTVFLEEVSEMPLASQAKLLRVLETRTFRRVGANTDQPLSARVVSATNRPVRGRDGEVLRADLYFRLAGYTLITPPLRERLEDLPALSQHFLDTFAKSHAFLPTRISPEALRALESHDWPGNVRELRAVLQAAVVRANSDVLGVRQVVQALYARGLHRGSEPPRAPSRVTPVRPTPVQGLRLGEPGNGPAPPPAPGRAAEASGVQSREFEGLPEVERTLILRVAGECDGNLSLAARRLKIPRSTLRDKLRRYGK